MQVIEKGEIIDRVMNGDHVYILMPIECMNIKELGERTKTGAVFAVSENEAQTVTQKKSIVVPPPPVKRRRGCSYDIEGIMSLYDAGWRYKDIADDKGLTFSQVSGVISRQLKSRKKEAGEKNAD